MFNWSELPDGIIDNIATRLDEVDDYIRFGSVCHSWRSVSITKMTRKKMNWGPWLMLPQRENNPTTEEEEDSDSDKVEVRRFFNISTKKIIKLYLPETRRRRCWGSSFGWLFTVGPDLNIHLINPLNRAQISLPSQPTFQDQYDDECYVEPTELRRIFLDKFALSWNPSTPPRDHSPLVVAVIYSEHGKLALASPGDKAWTTVKSPYGRYKDLIFFNNLLYAIACSGMLRVCDISAPEPETIDVVSVPDDIDSGQFYLVEISGDLHLVVRYFDAYEPDPNLELTGDFEVYKLDFQTKKWIQIFNLGDYALFIGTNTSFAISTSDHSAFKSNSIYFTDDCRQGYKHGGCDIGVFDCDEETVEPFYFGDDIRSFFCPPLFLKPNLW